MQTSVTVNPCVLPIEMTNFEANCNGNAIHVKWETSSELSNDYFDLKRSEDGLNFKSIGTTNGNGTSNHPNNYSFDDKAIEPGRVYYYKLNQVDYNKIIHDYDKLIFSDCGGLMSNDLEVYPIPADNEIFIMSNKEINNATIEIVDALGQKVKQISNVSVGKNKSFSFNVRDLSNGYYHLIISNEGSKIQKRIILSK